MAGCGEFFLPQPDTKTTETNSNELTQIAQMEGRRFHVGVSSIIILDQGAVVVVGGGVKCPVAVVGVRGEAGFPPEAGCEADGFTGGVPSELKSCLLLHPTDMTATKHTTANTRGRLIIH